MRQLRLWRSLNEANDLERVMLANPGLAWHSVTSNVCKGYQAILIHFRGSRREIESLKRDYIRRPPRNVRTIEILREKSNELVVYEVEQSGVSPTDLSSLIYQALGPETLVEVQKSFRGVFWRIITFREERIPAFLKQIREQQRRLEQLFSRKMDWYRVLGQSKRVSLVDRQPLEPAEAELLSLALENGYYESPKLSGIRELARKMRLPAATFHYRLRRAERKAVNLALGHVDAIRPAASVSGER